MKKFIKIMAAIVISTLVIIPQTGCGKKTETSQNGNGGSAESVEPVSKDSFYFDTVCQVTVYDMKDMSGENAEKVIEKAFKECAKYEKLLSKTKKGSDIDRINHAGGRPVKCDKLTIDVIKKGLEYSKLTNGRFDITIGKAQDLWNFEQKGSKGASRMSKPPARKKLAAAMKYVDYRQVKIDGDEVTMGTGKGEMDLGAIAKGYIADRISEYLKQNGVKSAIVNLGQSNVACIGDKHGAPFKVGIQKPVPESDEIVGAVEIKNGVVVTSGIYERYIEYKGKKYHHILDSKTGMPVDSDVAGVSIRAGYGNSTGGDGLSTTCLILGSEEGKKLIDSMKGYEAAFILKNGKIVKTDGFDLKKVD